MDCKYINLKACEEFTKKSKTARNKWMFICGLCFRARIIQLCEENRFYWKNTWHLYIFPISSILKCVSCPSTRDCLACEWCLAKTPWDSFSPCFTRNWLSLLTEKHRHNVNFICSHFCDSKWAVGREFNLLAKRFWTLWRMTVRFLTVLNERQDGCWIPFVGNKQRQLHSHDQRQD